MVKTMTYVIQEDDSLFGHLLEEQCPPDMAEREINDPVRRIVVYNEYVTQVYEDYFSS